jgi:CRISPR-associated protein Cmr3
MTIDLILTPRDGLTVKDARGFDRAGGIATGGLPWPGPATTAGATRAVVGRLLGLSEVFGQDKRAWKAIAEQVQVQGPIVLTKPLDEARWSPLWPAPQDALRLPHPRAGEDNDPEGRIRWLEPRPRDTTAWHVRGLWGAEPGETAATEGLWLPHPDVQSKPLAHHSLWSDDFMLDWLRRPPRTDRPRDERLAPQPQKRVDIHLAIDPGSLAAKDEALFTHPTYEPLVQMGRDKSVHELALALRVTGSDPGLDLCLPVWRIGGEGRFAAATLLPGEVLAIPEALARSWEDSRFLRLVLVTPAQFEAGWRPDWLEPSVTQGSTYQFEGTVPGLERRVALRAAFVDRAWWTSGWDLAEHRPKPSIACVAAGTVYYLESLAEPFTCADLRELWLGCIQRPGDAAARDGFGLVLPGAWPVSV